MPPDDCLRAACPAWHVGVVERLEAAHAKGVGATAGVYRAAYRVMSALEVEQLAQPDLHLLPGRISMRWAAGSRSLTVDIETGRLVARTSDNAQPIEGDPDRLEWVDRARRALAWVYPPPPRLWRRGDDDRHEGADP